VGSFVPGVGGEGVRVLDVFVEGVVVGCVGCDGSSGWCGWVGGRWHEARAEDLVDKA